MNLRKISIFIGLMGNKEIRKTLYDVHKRMSLDKNYSFIKFSKAFWNFLRYEKIIKFNDYFVVNSFFPPFPGKAFEQSFNSSGTDKNLFSNYSQGKKTAPLSCYIAATNLCPYHCWHCSAANRKDTDTLSTDVLKKLVKDLQEMGVTIIGFTGGEPTLREDLTEIISSIDSRSVSYVFSNGYNLTKERALAYKKAGLFGIAISVDHFNPAIHDKKRGYEGAFRKATEAIQNSLDAGLFTMMQTVITKDLLRSGEIWKIINLGKELGVHEIRILEPLKSGTLINGGDEIFLTNEERNQLIGIHKKANRIQSLPIVTTFAQFESKEQFGCGAGIHHCYIDASGNLYPCDFVPLSFGNVKENSFSDLWRKMNKIMGEKPRLNCFARENANRIKGFSKDYFPLDPSASEKICEGCLSNRSQLPKFFRTIGK